MSEARESVPKAAVEFSLRESPDPPEGPREELCPCLAASLVSAALGRAACAGQVTGQHVMPGLSGQWSGCCVGNLPSPCLNPEAFQSLSVPQTWGPELHHSCAGALPAFGALCWAAASLSCHSSSRPRLGILASEHSRLPGSAGLL